MNLSKELLSQPYQVVVEKLPSNEFIAYIPTLGDSLFRAVGDTEEEALEILDAIYDDLIAWMHEVGKPIPVPTKEDIKTQFDLLKDIWHEETKWYSSPTHDHWAAVAIVNLGEQAIPYVIEDMLKVETNWFEVIDRIVRPPVIDSNMTFKEGVDAWAEWAEKHGYV